MNALKLLDEITNSFRLVKCQWNNVPGYVLKKAMPIMRTGDDQAYRLVELIDGKRFSIEVKEIR